MQSKTNARDYNVFGVSAVRRVLGVRTRTYLRMLVGMVWLVAAMRTSSAAEMEVSITRGDGKATVMLGGEFFTNYVFRGHSKPILYPIVGPTGVEMTRHYPMKKGVDNEAHDHPHQKSLWFTHDDVNGQQFWLEYASPGDPKPGKIKQTSIKIGRSTIHTTNDWIANDGRLICKDTRTVGFGGSESQRFVDFKIKMTAASGDLTFGDTKEGTMGIRIHPLLRLSTDRKRGNHTAVGKAINSAGVEGKAIWGKRAKWVDYWGPIKGETVGIAVFDHPTNPRHPTWWHARPYGLVAANPFGVHDFENKPSGTGDMLVPANKAVTFRYRFVFHRGDHKQANVARLYEKFSGKQSEPKK